MTVTLELKPEVEARIIERAAVHGVPVEEFLRSVIEDSLRGEEATLFSETATAEEWMREFEEWVDSHDYITAPPADDSRESIYREREDSQL